MRLLKTSPLILLAIIVSGCAVTPQGDVTVQAVQSQPSTKVFDVRSTVTSAGQAAAKALM